MSARSSEARDVAKGLLIAALYAILILATLALPGLLVAAILSMAF